MIIVNFYGGPGAGKSTCAAYVFSKLKMYGISVELVNEYAKEKIWEENNIILSNQVYLFAKQYVGITRVQGKVDVVVMDSPMMLSVFYNKDTEIADSFEHLIVDCYHKFDNMDYWVSKTKDIRYDSVGRQQDEKEADEIGRSLIDILNKYKIDYQRITVIKKDLDRVVKDIIRRCDLNGCAT